MVRVAVHPWDVCLVDRHYYINFPAAQVVLA
jgi:hypothetical protein